MDAKRFGVATIVGGIVLFVVGYLIFDMMFGSFYAANVGSAPFASHSSPSNAPPLHVPSFSPSFATSSPAQTGHGCVGLTPKYRSPAIVADSSAAPVSLSTKPATSVVSRSRKHEGPPPHML